MVNREYIIFLFVCLVITHSLCISILFHTDKNKCNIIDVYFHPDTYKKGEEVSTCILCACAQSNTLSTVSIMKPEIMHLLYFSLPCLFIDSESSIQSIVAGHHIGWRRETERDQGRA